VPSNWTLNFADGHDNFDRQSLASSLGSSPHAKVSAAANLLFNSIDEVCDSSPNAIAGEKHTRNSHLKADIDNLFQISWTAQYWPVINQDSIDSWSHHFHVGARCAELAV
jgi:hypothetical protein